jgi:hypothetical protein
MSTSIMRGGVTLVSPTGVPALKAEDVAHASGDFGLPALVVQQTTMAALAGTTGDYAMLSVDDKGRLYVKDTSDTITDGTLAATTTGAALGASAACKEVILQSDPDNTVDVLVGDATNQRFQIVPGQSMVITIDNVSKVYAKTASGTGNVNWLALR